MYPSVSRIVSVATLLVALVGCQAGTPSHSSQPLTLTGDWTLVELYGQPAPTGDGDRPATIRFESGSARVSGFAGCNTFSATYLGGGDSIRFSVPVLTKKACAKGMDLERAFMDALTEADGYRLAPSGLTLFGSSGPLARFKRATP